MLVHLVDSEKFYHIYTIIKFVKNKNKLVIFYKKIIIFCIFRIFMNKVYDINFK